MIDYKVIETGLILIGKKNPYWNEMVRIEKQFGNKIIKRDDGRYYSIFAEDKPEKKSIEDIKSQPKVIDNSEKIMESMKTMMVANLAVIEKMVADVKKDIVELNKPVTPIIKEESLLQGDNFHIEVSRDNTGFIQSLEIKKSDKPPEKETTLWK